jgi:hypothetical protein
MKQTLVLALVITMVGSAATAADVAPIWDLAKDTIPTELQSGTVEKVDGKVALSDGAAFAVPASAFPDQRNFTVQVTATISELVNGQVFTAMKKQGEEDSGFSFYINYKDNPYWARRVSTVVNKIYMSEIGPDGQRGPVVDTPYTFTVSLRNGFASFYINDRPYKKCYMEVVPNDEPMWIGRSADPNTKPMNVVVQSVKVYGADFTYTSQKDPKTEFPRGVVAGKGWALDIPRIEHPEWPKVLIYGDSISMGYRGSFIPEMLKHQVYVFHCCHFINGDVPKQAMAEMASRFTFDAVVFNNGLHSLHWTPEAVSDQKVHDRMRDLAECFKKGAPDAKIYYLMTTPHTAKRPSPKEPVKDLGDKNDVVIRLNTISAQVMKEENIEIIDIYSVLAEKLELASGDGYHWQGPAYKIISDELAKRILPVLGK